MTVGVVLPVHNGCDHVGAAIESVLAQTHAALDLVVVDDGSADGTADVVRSYDDPRLTLLENDRNLGVAASRNRGAAHVDGDTLAFIDHDDVWHPEKLARHVEAHGGGADLVYSDIREIDDDGSILGERALPDPAPTGPPLVRQLLFQGGAVIVTMSSVTVRRTAWERVGGENTDCRVSGDVDLYVRLAGTCAFERLPKPLVDKREHAANISDDYRAIYRDHERVLDRALERYPFIDEEEERRKRARMAYRRATSALVAGESGEAAEFARESIAADRQLRPALVLVLATLDRVAGPFDPGRRLYRRYDR